MSNREKIITLAALTLASWSLVISAIVFLHK